MRLHLEWTLFLLLAVTTISPPATCASQEDPVRQTEALLSKVVQPDEPGMAVLVKQHGQILFEKGFGLRRLGDQARITTDTNFRLASVTKQFTAMAVMLLVHDGKLRYESTLTEVFPDFPAYGKTITIRHLLTHTSGLPDYEDLMEKEEKAHGERWSPEHQIQDEEVLELLKRETKGKFAPGASWAYSNSGYVVLGLIIAKISGSSYADFLRKRIFVPLHMQHTVVYQKGENEIPSRAYGHSLDKGKFILTDQSSTSATLGDGGVYSNVRDLSKWDDALGNYALLPEKEIQASLTPVKLADGSEPHWPTEPDGDNLAPGKPVAYGFGWFLDPYQGHARMWHSGSTMGFRNVTERFTSDGLTIVILCNRADLEPASLAMQIANLYLGKLE